MNIFNKFPLVRFKQIRDYPTFLWHYLKRLCYYKYISHTYIPRYKKFLFLSPQETLDYLIDRRASLARFSDGDMEQLTGAGEYPPDSDWTQRSSLELRRRLEEVLYSDREDLLIAHESPEVFCLSRKEAMQKGVIYNMWTDTRMILFKYLKQNKPYGHAHVFIPSHHPNFNWGKLYEYLKDRDVIIVTGGTSSLGNVSLGKRNFFVEAGKHDAFERYREISNDLMMLIKTEGLSRENTIIMASLGPTADILAFDLVQEGWQVWDTGHFFRYTDRQLFSLGGRQVFTKQFYNQSPQSVEEQFNKDIALHAASEHVLGLVMPKPLSHTKTTITYERLNLPLLLRDMLKSEKWQTDVFDRIGACFGGLHSNLALSSVVAPHGDFTVHNIAVDGTSVYIFDSAPPRISMSFYEMHKNNTYFDIASFIVSLFTYAPFDRRFWRLYLSKRACVSTFIRSYENASHVTVNERECVQEIMLALDFWKTWQCAYGYSVLAVYVKYSVLKTVLWWQIYICKILKS